MSVFPLSEHKMNGVPIHLKYEANAIEKCNCFDLKICGVKVPPIHSSSARIQRVLIANWQNLANAEGKHNIKCIFGNPLISVVCVCVCESNQNKTQHDQTNYLQCGVLLFCTLHFAMLKSSKIYTYVYLCERSSFACDVHFIPFQDELNKSLPLLLSLVRSFMCFFFYLATVHINYGDLIELHQF